ncbi:hypothetical protein [Jiangella endophytica]|nr:hypothetical protein [Jiangella endophytica]
MTGLSARTLRFGNQAPVPWGRDVPLGQEGPITGLYVVIAS